jgi:hypothetical protein
MGADVKLKIFLVAGISFFVAACTASRPAPVAVTGDSTPLVGTWTGSYTSPSTGRSGSIVFTLGAAGQSARGDVVMTDATSGKVFERANREGPNVQMGGQSQVLTIQLVRVGDGTVTGTLDPYRDPACNCPVETTFTGRLDGDTIAGTFATRGSEIPTQTGTWHMKQTKK